MTGQVKIRLKRGDQEIDVEGTRADVDQLLSKWWSEPLDPGSPQRTATKTKHKPTANSVRRSSAADSQPEDNGVFNPVDVCNRLKGHEHYKLAERKILHVRGEHWQKAALVLWFTDAGLTSGEILSVLKQLRCKTTQPRISEALDRHSGELLHDGRRQQGSAPRYTLSAQARAAFEARLTASKSEGPKTDAA